MVVVPGLGVHGTFSGLAVKTLKSGQPLLREGFSMGRYQKRKGCPYRIWAKERPV